LKTTRRRQWIIGSSLLAGSLLTTFALGNSYQLGNAQSGQPDLAVASDNVWISPQRPLGGDIVTLKAAVQNNGAADATGVAVDFSDNADGALQVPVAVGSAMVDVPAGGTSIAQISWDTAGELGENTITVTIDPGDQVPEADESNNQTGAIMFVSTAWGDVNCFGDVNSVDALAILRWKAGLDFNHVEPCPVLGQ
jgi:hypothetical protein